MTEKPTRQPHDDFDVLNLPPTREERADKIYRIAFLVFMSIALVAGCYFKL